MRHEYTIKYKNTSRNNLDAEGATIAQLAPIHFFLYSGPMEHIRKTSEKKKRTPRATKSDLQRMVEWTGSINQETSDKVSSQIKTLMQKDPARHIELLITSPGGPTGVGMSFYDLMTKVIRPRLHTIGSGDVDSAAIMVFL